MALGSKRNCKIGRQTTGGGLNENRIKLVGFGDGPIYKAFQNLKSGKFEEKELALFIQRAIDDLKANPFIGVPIPHKLWPVVYIRKFSINNLRKYNLPNGWRLIYTLKANEVEIVSIILEWFSHKEYERRFNY